MTAPRKRTHRPIQRVPAAPFVEWLQQRLAAYDADVTTPRMHEHGVSPAVRILSEDLGVSDRTLYRYSRSLNAAGEYTEVFRRPLVENMLERAGIRFDDLYPGVDPDIPLEPMQFCPTCETGVHPLKGRCPWCNTGTGKSPNGVRYTHRKPMVSDHQLRSLHMLHINCGLPIIELARQSWQRLGYGSAGSCDNAIRRGWKRLELQAMSPSESWKAGQRYNRRRDDGRVAA